MWVLVAVSEHSHPTITVPQKDRPITWAPAGIKQVFLILTSCWAELIQIYPSISAPIGKGLTILVS